MKQSDVFLLCKWTYGDFSSKPEDSHCPDKNGGTRRFPTITLSLSSYFAMKPFFCSKTTWGYSFFLTSCRRVSLILLFGLVRFPPPSPLRGFTSPFLLLQAKKCLDLPSPRSARKNFPIEPLLTPRLIESLFFLLCLVNSLPSFAQRG